jgi:hypothetical protein
MLGLARSSGVRAKVNPLHQFPCQPSIDAGGMVVVGGPKIVPCAPKEKRKEEGEPTVALGAGSATGRFIEPGYVEP